jgi:hypothetical protein
VATYQDYRVGRTIYADDIKLLRKKEQETPRGSLYNAELQLIRKDYTSLVSKIDRIDSDNIITPQEKIILQREWSQLNALRSLTMTKAEEYNIQSMTTYQNYVASYTALNNLVSYILDPITIDEDTDMTGQGDLSAAFEDYFTKAQLVDEQIFRYETGMIGGLDYRVKFDLNVLATKNPVPLDGTPSTLSAQLLDDNQDVTSDYDVSCFRWYRITEDREADATWDANHATPAKSITVSIDDLVYGYATFLCKMTYYYSETMFIESSGIITVSKEIPGPKGEDAYQVQIISLNGTVFRMDGTLSTTLEVRVWQGGEEITDLFTDADFRWRRTSNEPYQDTLWNSAHYASGGKSITITQEDVIGRCSFFCDLLRERS